MKAIGIILAGGNNKRMKELSYNRAIAAMPMVGTYRSIDFALSNMSNSRIQKVAVLTQYNTVSLNEHLNSSKWWDFGRKQGGLYVFTPTITAENSNWYRGTADALYQNLHFLKGSHEPYVVLASGDGIYKLDYNKILDLYTLDIPNKEVRLGLMESLLPNYVGNETPEATTMVAYLFYDIQNGDMDSALRRLQAFLSTVPYCDNTKYEGHYQQLFYVIFSLLNYYVDIEVRTPRGRVDVVLRTKTTLYVMELKLDKTAGEAMEQINLKNYPERFSLCGLPVVKVAINFDSERCTIGDWMIEK